VLESLRTASVLTSVELTESFIAQIVRQRPSTRRY
jgi:hypothetical protein